MKPGDQVAGYLVEELLGEGAAGQVFGVLHVERDTRYAMKYLPLAGSRAKDRLVREAAMQVGLSHPNLVAVHEIVDVSSDPAVIMERVLGPTLQEWLLQSQPGLIEAEAIFRGVCEGVCHAHRRGLVHCDLKPANILMAPTSHGLVPKVADFGIATLGGASTANTGKLVGTPGYMAPEQSIPGAATDQRADLFALGCLLYELLCGVRPFTGTPDQIAKKVRRGDYPPLDEVRPGLPRRFVRVIESALQPDPGHRPWSCDQLVDLLGEEEDMPPGTVDDFDEVDVATVLPLVALSAAFCFIVGLIATFYIL